MYLYLKNDKLYKTLNIFKCLVFIVLTFTYNILYNTTSKYLNIIQQNM